MSLRVLALSPYHGGSHEQFLEDWSARSRHSFTLLSLPPRHFKWRIRQASVGMANKIRSLENAGAAFDVVFTTSMLDVAELRGLVSPSVHSLPLVVYFHENQLVYPTQSEDKRDQHLPLINWVSALAADSVWFNSAYNRDSLLVGLESLLQKMPDEPELRSLPTILERSRIEPLGIVPFLRKPKSDGPLHISWVARWEHDKRPDRFFGALAKLQERGVPFCLTVLGQSFRVWPPEFDEARERLASAVVHFGYLPVRSEYESALAPCDVVVSTADHEFFGVALLEAVSTGAFPLVPDRLVYPEIYPSACRYQSDEELVAKLVQLAQTKQSQGSLARPYDEHQLGALSRRYDFERRAPELDDALARVCETQPKSPAK